MAPITPKLKVPLQMGASGFQVTEQDSPDEVAGAVYAVVATQRGTRLELNEFGVEDPSFEQLPLSDEVLAEWLSQIDRFEFRANCRTWQDVERQLVTVGVIER